jgi:hypothetical protein
LKNESQIKGLPNIKSIDGMVYKKYKYEFGPKALFSPFLWWHHGFLAIIYWKNPIKWKGVDVSDIPGC